MNYSSGPLPTAWQWEESRGRNALERLAPAWDELVRARDLPFVSGALWMRCFWDAFGDGGQGPVLLSAFQDGRLVAVLPLWQAGRLLRSWSPVSNFHSPALVFASEQPPAGAAAGFLDRLLASGNVVDAGRTQPAAEFRAALLEAARSRRLPVVESAVESDAIIELRGPWEAFRRSLSQNLETTTSRHHRQLQKLGELVFEEITGGDRLAPVLQECFRLEAAGWKANQGSPILSRQDTLRFYTDLAHRGANAGALAVYALRLDGKLIAFEYCLRAGQRIDMLKISYAPELARYSPGNVLRYLILKTEVERGRIAIYHMGRSSDWKLRWANRVDPIVRLRIYGPGARARLACWGARLRLLLRECGPLRTAVRRARSMGGMLTGRRWTAARATERTDA